MIYYASSYLCILFSGIGPLRAALIQRVMWNAVLVAFPAAMLAYGVKALDQTNGFLDMVMPDVTVYSTFTGGLGFLIVFKTSQSYQRFEEGAKLLYVMQADFFEAGALLISLSRTSVCDDQQVYDFRRVVIRLVSLLNGLCCKELSGIDLTTVDEIADGVVDVYGLDADTLKVIDRSAYKADAACHLLQNTISDALMTILKGVPPPLITRVYQELGGGMIRFSEAHKLSDVPFPFPFSICLEVILLLHWLFTPFQMAQSANGPVGAATFTLGFTVFFWCLKGLGNELEDPFGSDLNDLDLEGVTEGLNRRLLALLLNSKMKTPGLSPECNREEELWDTQQACSMDFEPLLAASASSASSIICYGNDVKITRNKSMEDFESNRSRISSLFSKKPPVTLSRPPRPSTISNGAAPVSGAERPIQPNDRDLPAGANLPRASGDERKQVFALDRTPVGMAPACIGSHHWSSAVLDDPSAIPTTGKVRAQFFTDTPTVAEFPAFTDGGEEFLDQPMTTQPFTSSLLASPLRSPPGSETEQSSNTCFRDCEVRAGSPGSNVIL